MFFNIPQYRWSATALAIALGLGITPGLFNAAVDPYRMHGLFDLGLEKKKIATTKHGPLYKIIEYPRHKSSYLVFGDSRSRALRDKLFHELGFIDFYNFSYRGGTIAETIDSFWYATQHADIKGVAIGVPLRSMSSKFSKGKNQVPESIRLRDKPMSYYANLFVADTGISILDKHYPNQMNEFRTTINGMMRLIPFAPGSASAQEGTDLKAGYCEAVCTSVSGSIWNNDVNSFTSGRAIVKGSNIDLLLDGGGTSTTGLPTLGKTEANITPRPPVHVPALTVPPVVPVPEVDTAWLRKVEKGGRNDWKKFTINEDYYQGLREIAAYAKEEEIDVVFFIPPAHADMQAQIGKWNRAEENLEHRRRIAELGPILDYDVPTEETNDRDNFTDPYHFKANVARSMAMDIMQQFDAPEKTLKKIERRRKETRKVSRIQCPTGPTDPMAVKLPGEQSAWMGKGCILWGQKG